ncbi:glyoxalase superfamily protein [Pseudoteredinibacter isoporae]|uniref:Bleomycin resistance protein n=1 Tax=Pseudoteredinibacter isoporae TaxID=570281 RepID=A0A7X0JPC2_9GAMM|nr:glyoxalase superfamily protein [Pseudoteredinibacter isoporae]MBB6519838.1 putative glyoxalase superfamily protein PhnB [Pseudoteredinibacter isoporae]NHO85417.1 VOC family protein [Pseudoteredinibacter isoporae]NIB26131.1 VOC family protein [Pseudoteredinibacter isoporae]
MNYQTIPVLRIFDEEKAKAFYLDFLGMNLDWEHRFEANYPVYMQVSKQNLVLHLSEHSGDCSPGAKTFIHCDDVDMLFSELQEKNNKYCKPEIETAPWGDRSLTVIDPFSNRLLFNER